MIVTASTRADLRLPVILISMNPFRTLLWRSDIPCRVASGVVTLCNGDVVLKRHQLSRSQSRYLSRYRHPNSRCEGGRVFHRIISVASGREGLHRIRDSGVRVLASQGLA